MHYIEFYNLLLVTKIHGYMHTDYTATFSTCLPSSRRHMVGTGGLQAVFFQHGRCGVINPPPCGHLYRARPQTYSVGETTRQPGGCTCSLVRSRAVLSNGSLSDECVKKPAKAGQRVPQRRQSAAIAPARPLLSPQPRKMAVSRGVLWAEHSDLSSLALHCL